MDENRSAYSLEAPGSGGPGSAMRLLARDSFPDVDDRLVEPEITRDEIVNGRRVVAAPAEAPHANQHSRLNYVLRAHVAPGYRSATRLLTRYAVDSDFASDSCVYRKGTDPANGSRHLEEIAFEVVSPQNEKLATEKAVLMHLRGVRRIFGVWVENREVREWTTESESWRSMEATSQIEDPCLVVALEVASLFDAEGADNAVIEALAAKGNPAILRSEAEAKARARASALGRAEGVAKGMAEGILRFLAARGVAVNEAQRQEILRCQDLERLDRWVDRTAFASSADEVIIEP